MMTATTEEIVRRGEHYLAALHDWDAAAGRSARDFNPPRLEDEVLGLLGCPYLHSSGQFAFQHITHAEVGAGSLPVVQHLLPRLLEATVEHLPHTGQAIASLLAGIEQSGCLDRCLSNDSTTYALAAALYFFCGTYEVLWPLDAYVKNDVCSMLNKWLRPLDEWSEPPAGIEVAEALFGPAWCHFHITENSEITEQGQDIDVGLATGVIVRNRPAFLPSLRSVSPLQAGDVGMPLPASLSGLG
jgi:hypothetical protein